MKIGKPTPEELCDYNAYDLTSGVPWDPSLYEIDDSCDEEHKSRIVLASKSKLSELDWDHLQKCLGWKPIDAVTKTLQATTQYAQSYVRLPMRMHYKSRFSALNVNRLR